MRGFRKITPPIAFAALIAASFFPGCTSFRHRQSVSAHSAPLVAVEDFVNRSSFDGHYGLDREFRDLFVLQLAESGRALPVIKSGSQSAGLASLVRQGKALLGLDATPGAPSSVNARYAVRGTITEFTAPGEPQAWFYVEPGRKVSARVGLFIQVQDLETGDLLLSERFSGSGGGSGANLDYRRIPFGGDAFYRTPLGRAVESASSKAVKNILRKLPKSVWQARVADAGPNHLVINGGKNVGLKPGAVFVVRSPPRVVTDPVDGRMLESVPGEVSGKLRITVVNEASSHAVLLEGTARRGYALEVLP